MNPPSAANRTSSTEGVRVEVGKRMCGRVCEDEIIEGVFEDGRVGRWEGWVRGVVEDFDEPTLRGKQNFV